MRCPEMANWEKPLSEQKYLDPMENHTLKYFRPSKRYGRLRLSLCDGRVTERFLDKPNYLILNVFFM